ncbi:MAG TPA: hypothetical protein VFE47_30715 [Tepidisphaeraceae bacterium]|jgi:sRNA-binding carbon storage regulator CsrA|nr:hypothetical protein [Tepidisphaeraceae bacterium]
MLALSRHKGQSVVVGDRTGHWFITVASVTPAGVSVRIESGGRLDSQTAELTEHVPIQVGGKVEIHLLDVCEDRGRVRLGFIAPKGFHLHRFEIWNALLAEGTAGFFDGPGSFL